MKTNEINVAQHFSSTNLSIFPWQENNIKQFICYRCEPVLITDFIYHGQLFM